MQGLCPCINLPRVQGLSAPHKLHRPLVNGLIPDDEQLVPGKKLRVRAGGEDGPSRAVDGDDGGAGVVPEAGGGDGLAHQRAVLTDGQLEGGGSKSVPL